MLVGNVCMNTCYSELLAKPMTTAGLQPSESHAHAIPTAIDTTPRVYICTARVAIYI